MKSIFLTITVFTMAVMITACEKESDLSDELSAEDKIAVEGMEEALHTAEAYQDSLVWCDDPANNCDTAFVQYCDSLFHFGDAEYERHHNNYSHNNREDDHHHSGTNNHHHGSGGGHDEDEGDDHGHSIESHNEMNELRAVHLQYPPHR